MLGCNITGFKIPTCKRHPVGYLQGWPRICTNDDLEQIQPEQDSNPQLLDRESDTLTTRPGCLPLGVKG